MQSEDTTQSEREVALTAVQVHPCQHFWIKLSSINWEIFVVKLFSDSMASRKFKHTKITHIINNSVVQGRLFEN